MFYFLWKHLLEERAGGGRASPQRSGRTLQPSAAAGRGGGKVWPCLTVAFPLSHIFWQATPLSKSPTADFGISATVCDTYWLQLRLRETSRSSAPRPGRTQHGHFDGRDDKRASTSSRWYLWNAKSSFKNVPSSWVTWQWVGPTASSEPLLRNEISGFWPKPGCLVSERSRRDAASHTRRSPDTHTERLALGTSGLRLPTNDSMG